MGYSLYARYAIAINHLHRLAKPRGGRRPGGQLRPLGHSGSPSQSFPPPSWGSNDFQTTTIEPQPFSTSHVQPPNVQSALFPSSGNNSDAGSNQQFSAPSATGFNFSAGSGTPISNPFVSQNPNPSSSAQTGGFQGSIFSFPQPNSTSSPQPHPSTIPSPLNENKEQNHQNIFTAHAPFKWGNVETPVERDSHQNAAKPASDAFQLQSLQSSSNASESNGQFPIQPNGQPFPTQNQQSNQSSSIFGHQNQQGAYTSKNFFGQFGGQQSESEPKQSVPSFFGHIGSQQSTSANSIFSRTAAQPAPDGDSMSTTPDTSPQTNRQANEGAFAFLNASSASRQPSSNSPGSSKGPFASISQASSNQSISTTTTEKESSQPISDELFKANGIASNMSSKSSNLVATSLKQSEDSAPKPRPGKIIQPDRNIPQIPDNKPFATSIFESSKMLPSTSAPSNPFTSTYPQLATSMGSQQRDLATSDMSKNRSTPFLSAFPHEDSKASSSVQARTPGRPPPAPTDFTAQQKRTLITGYRLKSLDVGFKGYIASSPNFHNESEAVTNFYTKRKEVILEANGEPLGDVADNYELRQTNMGSLGDNNLGKSTVSGRLPNGLASYGGDLNKRKATDDPQDGVFGRDISGVKRARRQNEVSHPMGGSLNSQTSSVFKNILGNKSGSSPLGSIQTSKGSSQLPTTSSESLGSTRFNSPSKPAKLNASFLPQRPISQQSGNNKVTAEASSSFSKPAVNPSKGSTFANPFPPPPESTHIKPSSPSKPSNFKPPTFNNGAPGNFLAQFGQAAEAEARREKAKRKAEDQESDEDDDQWDLKDAEAQQAKKQKIEEIAKTSRKFTLVNGDRENQTSKWPQRVEQSNNSASSIFSKKPTLSQNASHNIFAHLSDVDSGAEGSKTEDADDEGTGSEDEKEVEMNDNKGDANTIPNASSGLFSQANSYGFTPKLGSQPPSKSTSKETDRGESSGRSLFDRISKDKDGNPAKEVQSSGQANAGSLFQFPQPNKTDDIFGASGHRSSGNLFATGPSATGRGISDNGGSTSKSESTSVFPTTNSSSNVFNPSVSSSQAPTTSIFSSSGSPSNNTWNPDTPIKFGNQSDPPAVSVISPSPSKSSHNGIFGASRSSVLPDNESKTSSGQLGTPPKPPSLFGFASGGPLQSQNSTLALPFNVPSSATSRATSPGLTTGESANESAGGDVDDEAPKEEQIDLSNGGPGEDDEDIIYDVKAKALKYDAKKETPEKKEWVTRGVGRCRVLKHRETGKVRILMRQEAIGKIALNVGLLPSLWYVQEKKCVRVPVPVDQGKIESWMVQVGKVEDAAALARVLEENKSA
ncbi:MAG: hypothetical protein LQ342_000420 [Letrouitia transgressa]|nr:MAG: hypothetical protein LQ342_000420 [Letrouitia transgressa]